MTVMPAPTEWRTQKRADGQISLAAKFARGDPADLSQPMAALSTTHGFADRHSDPLALPRLAVGPNPSLALFRLKISGFNLRWVHLLADRVLRRERVEATSEVGACG